MGIRAALILTLGLILAAYAHGGRYQMAAFRASDGNPIAYRLDKFTGRVDYCFELTGTKGRCW